MVPLAAWMLLALASPSAAAPGPNSCKDSDDWLIQPPPGLCAMPEDVRKAVRDFDMCVHFGGEEAWDEAREKQILEGFRRYCDPAPARLAALKRKYRRDPRISHWLEDYSHLLKSHDY